MLGTIGVWLLVAGALAIIIEMALVAVWGARMTRRSRALAERIENERSMIQADVERLKRAIEETRMLWRPYGRILRWLRHPLVVALIGSYRRRMAAR
jgi:C4-dicarboxylate-specific signal transduction histidine kinase